MKLRLLSRERTKVILQDAAWTFVILAATLVVIKAIITFG